MLGSAAPKQAGAEKGMVGIAGGTGKGVVGTTGSTWKGVAGTAGVASTRGLWHGRDMHGHYVGAAPERKVVWTGYGWPGQATGVAGSDGAPGGCTYVA